MACSNPARTEIKSRKSREETARSKLKTRQTSRSVFGSESDESNVRTDIRNVYEGCVYFGTKKWT